MLSKTKCRLGANRETSPRNDDPLNFDSLITASKWTSCNAEWQNKISSLCLNTVAGYSEEAPSILWVYHSYAHQYLLALVALISRWIQKFSANRGSYLQCFSWLKQIPPMMLSDRSAHTACEMIVYVLKAPFLFPSLPSRFFHPFSKQRACSQAMFDGLYYLAG